MMTRLKQIMWIFVIVFCFSFWAILFIVLGCKTPPLPDPIPFPTTTTTTVPPVSGSPAKVHTGAGWVDWKDLTQNVTITDYTINASRFWAAYSGYESWQSSDGQTCGFICMMWEYDGVMQGEYWDGMARQPSYGYVSFFHITDPTSPFAGRLPVSGQKVGMFFVSEDNQYRSSIAWTEWPL